MVSLIGNEAVTAAKASTLSLQSPGKHTLLFGDPWTRILR